MVARPQDGLLAQMRRGTLEYCVMALLREKERYGFDLVRALSETEGMVTSEGTIYPLLSRLRRDGLVATTWRESPTGPPRRYYRLTESGRAALEEFVNEWARFRDAVDKFVKGDHDDERHRRSPGGELSQTPEEGPERRAAPTTAGDPGGDRGPHRRRARGLGSAGDAELRELLKRLGDPDDIAAEACLRFEVRPARTGAREIGP